MSRNMRSLRPPEQRYMYRGMCRMASAMSERRRVQFSAMYEPATDMLDFFNEIAADEVFHRSHAG